MELGGSRCERAQTSGDGWRGERREGGRGEEEEEEEEGFQKGGRTESLLVCSWMMSLYFPSGR